MNDSRTTRVWGWIAEYAGKHRTAVSLRTVCEACPDRVGVTGVGVTVQTAAAGGESVFATDQVAGRLQDLQFTLGEGPCINAMRFGFPVFAPELGSTPSVRSWPVFAPAAVLEGAMAMAVVPMIIGAVRVGVFTVYRTQPGSLSTDQLADVFVFADIALQLLLDARAGTPGEADRWLDGGEPLGRAEVHQATGMISAQLDIGTEDALLRLRAYAFSHHRPVTEVARDVVARRLRFEPDLP